MRHKPSEHGTTERLCELMSEGGPGPQTDNTAAAPACHLMVQSYAVDDGGHHAGASIRGGQ